MEVRACDLEHELARANNERDTQRAATEQTAQESQQQIAALRENVEALTTKCQQQEEALEARVMSPAQVRLDEKPDTPIRIPRIPQS